MYGIQLAFSLTVAMVSKGSGVAGGEGEGKDPSCLAGTPGSGGVVGGCVPALPPGRPGSARLLLQCTLACWGPWDSSQGVGGAVWERWHSASDREQAGSPWEADLAVYREWRL